MIVMNKYLYSKLLQRPEWAAKRALILKRDKYSCTKCSLTSISGKNLQVHHTYYEGDMFPWDYPDSSLVTLCRKCHEKEHPEKQVESYNKPSELNVSANVAAKLTLPLKKLRLLILLQALCDNEGVVELTNTLRLTLKQKFALKNGDLDKYLYALARKKLVFYDRRYITLL